MCPNPYCLLTPGGLLTLGGEPYRSVRILAVIGVYGTLLAIVLYGIFRRVHLPRYRRKGMLVPYGEHIDPASRKPRQPGPRRRSTAVASKFVVVDIIDRHHCCLHCHRGSDRDPAYCRLVQGGVVSARRPLARIYLMPSKRPPPPGTPLPGP